MNETLKNYRLTLESFEGKCKRITVQAACASDAMGLYMFGKWIAVDVYEIKVV